MRMNKLVN